MAVAITYLCFTKKEEVSYRMQWILSWKKKILKAILGIAIPNGIESGISQLVKVALSSIVAMFGTYQIAANGVAQSIWSLAALAGVAMEPVFVTVIGQCMGAGNVDAAEANFKRLNGITLKLSIAWNLFILALTPLFMHTYALEPKTKVLVIWLVVLHNLFNAFVFPFAGALSSGLRAAGDVRYTMKVSIIATIAVRLLLSYVLGVKADLGVIGIALAMTADWMFRAVACLKRQKSGAWKRFRVI